MKGETSESDSDIVVLDKTQEVERIVGIDRDIYSDVDSVQYYVKFKERSYMSCPWMRKKDILASDNGPNSLKAFKQLIKSNGNKKLIPVPFISSLYIPDSTIFTSGFVLQDGVCSYRKSQTNPAKYLVKWKALDYTNATWEEDAKGESVENYFRSVQESVPLRFDINALKKMDRSSLNIADIPTLSPNENNIFSAVFKNWKNHKNAIISANQFNQSEINESVALLDAIVGCIGHKGVSFILTKLSKVAKWMKIIQKNSNLRAIQFDGTEENRRIIKTRVIPPIETNGFEKMNYSRFDIIIIPTDLNLDELSYFGQFNSVCSIFDTDLVHDYRLPKYFTLKSISSNSAFTLAITEIPPILNEATAITNNNNNNNSTNNTNSSTNSTNSTNTNNNTNNNSAINKHKIYSILKFVDSIKFNNFEEYCLLNENEIADEIAYFCESMSGTTYVQTRRFLVESANTDVQRELLKRLIVNMSEFLEFGQRKVIRKLCKLYSHPYLIKGFDGICRNNYLNKNRISPKTPIHEEEELLVMILSSGKLKSLSDVLSAETNPNQKIVVCTKYRKMVKFISVFLHLTNILFATIESTPDIISSAKVYIACTKLEDIEARAVECDKLIFYDCDFDKYLRQSFKIKGDSNKKISIIYLVTQNSVDSVMFNLAQIVSEVSSKQATAAVDITNLNESTILKYGVYFAMRGNQAGNCTTIEDRLIIRPLPKLMVSSIVPNSAAETEISNPKFWTNTIGDLKTSSFFETDSFVPEVVEQPLTFSQQISPKIEIERDQFEFAMKALKTHGVLGLRVAVSEYFKMLAEAVFCAIYLRMPIPLQLRYKGYVTTVIRNPYLVIESIPTNKFHDDEFLTSLFNGKEVSLFNSFFLADQKYTVSIYISNVPLPEEFQFAPSMPTPVGWGPVDDFLMIIGSEIVGNNISDFLRTDYRLPFSRFPPEVLPSSKWFNDRESIIINEIYQIIPENFCISDRKLQDVDYFRKMNPTMFKLHEISRQIQKRILRVIYLYGIPQTNVIQKIKEVAMVSHISDETVAGFVNAIIGRCAGFDHDLAKLKIVNAKDETKFTETKSIDWIPSEVIEAIADNLVVVSYVRSNFLFFNKITIKSEKWIFQWWDEECDKILFNVTAFYGFTFLSTFSIFIPISSLKSSTIYAWKEKEAKTLTPCTCESAAHLDKLLPIEVKKERLKHIMNLIRNKEYTENEDEE